MSDSKKSYSPKQTSVFGPAGMRRRKASPSEAPSANDLLAQLTGLSQKIAAHAVRFQIGEIVTQARSLQNYLHSQPTGTPEWQSYIRECLLSALETTGPFVTLYSHLTEPTDPIIARFNNFLTALSHTLGHLHARLAAEPSAIVPSGIETYRATLRHIERAYRGSDQPG